jgi:hypothetical protein
LRRPFGLLASDQTGSAMGDRAQNDLRVRICPTRSEHHRCDYKQSMHRRHFLFRSYSASVGLLAGPQILRAAAVKQRPELRISRIVVQNARGRRLTPVAPNATLTSRRAPPRVRR